MKNSEIEAFSTEVAQHVAQSLFSRLTGDARDWMIGEENPDLIRERVNSFGAYVVNPPAGETVNGEILFNKARSMGLSLAGAYQDQSPARKIAFHFFALTATEVTAELKRMRAAETPEGAPAKRLVAPALNEIIGHDEDLSGLGTVEPHAKEALDIEKGRAALTPATRTGKGKAKSAVGAAELAAANAEIARQAAALEAQQKAKKALAPAKAKAPAKTAKAKAQAPATPKKAKKKGRK